MFKNSILIFHYFVNKKWQVNDLPFLTILICAGNFDFSADKFFIHIAHIIWMVKAMHLTNFFKPNFFNKILHFVIVLMRINTNTSYFWMVLLNIIE